MKNLNANIDAAYWQRKSTNDAKIAHLKSCNPHHIDYNTRDLTEKINNHTEGLRRKKTFNALIEAAQDHLLKLLNSKLETETEEKIITFVLYSPKGTRSLTSLYDKSKQARRMIEDLQNYTLDEIKELAQLPEIASITGMLSGKGLRHSLAEIKEFIAKCHELGIDIRQLATVFSRKGLPTTDQLPHFKKNINYKK